MIHSPLAALIRQYDDVATVGDMPVLIAVSADSTRIEADILKHPVRAKPVGSVDEAVSARSCGNANDLYHTPSVPTTRSCPSVTVRPMSKKKNYKARMLLLRLETVCASVVYHN